ncbi:hypothetical protein [Bosea sp. AS-1]|nr:hypothetical protein [Bosea sp. AS-1]
MQIGRIDEARRLLQPERLRQNVQLGPRDPEIDALAQGLRLDRLD